MKNHTIDALNWRYATKVFDSTRTLSAEQETIILESLRLSASSFGLQPWKFIVVRDGAKRQELRKAAWDQGQITDSSLLVVLATPKNVDAKLVAAYIDSVSTIEHVDRKNLAGYETMINNSITAKGEANARDWAARQAYVAMGTALLAAAENAIDACPMEGFDPARFDSILGLDKLGFESRAVIAFGFRSSTDKHATETKVRFSKKEVFLEM